MVDSEHEDHRSDDERRMERAKELGAHVDTAMFNLWQEYKIDVNRREETIGNPNRYFSSYIRDPLYEGEIDKYNRIIFSFGIPLNEPDEPPFGNVHVQYGEEAGLFIVEGAGRWLKDPHREDFSSFTLRFDDNASQRNFLDWLREEQHIALRYIFDRVANKEDANGNPILENVPPRHAQQKGHGHPFETPFANLYIKERPRHPIRVDEPQWGRLFPRLRRRHK